MQQPEINPDKTSGVGWTSKSVGSQRQHNIFYGLIRYGGRKSAYILLWFVALYYALFRPSIRRKAYPYLSKRFPGKGPAGRLSDTRKLYYSLGRTLIDRAAIGILGRNSVKLTFPDKNRLLEIIHEGRGVILMTAHVGNWQTSLAGLDDFGTPKHLLIHREAGDIDLHYYEHSNKDRPFQIIDPAGYMGGVIEIIQALKRGEVVSIMGDRILGSERGTVPVGFLGHAARFPVSAYKFASATGSPVAILFSHSNGPGGYELSLAGVLRIPKETSSPEDYKKYAQHFADMLESYTGRYPYEFFNFFDMWSVEDKSPDKKKG